jgi:phosphoglucosamine mutase
MADGNVPPRLFGTDGVRRVVGEELTPTFATEFACALAHLLRGEGPVLVGRDFRTSSQPLSRILSGALSMSGLDTIDVGQLPTPCFQFNVKTLRARLGTMVTASHNPTPFNGIKVTGPEGLEIPREDEEVVERAMAEKTFPKVPWNRVGTVRADPGAIDRYLASIRANVDVAAIAHAAPRVVLDCGNGTSAVTSPRLLRELGTRLTTLNANADGYFPGHPSEPTDENLADLKATVVAVGAALGVAHDGDSDRVAFVDEKGRYVPGEETLALFAKWMLGKHPGATIATSITSSSVVSDVVRESGGKLSVSRSGSLPVARSAIETGAVFAGEENGGYYWPTHQVARDGPMSSAKMLELLVETGRPLSELLAELPKYHVIKRKIELPDGLKPALVEAVAKALKHEAEYISALDGIKAFYGDGWLLVRPSGTEPICRVFAESRDRARAERLNARGVELVKGLVEELRAGIPAGGPARRLSRPARDLMRGVVPPLGSLTASGPAGPPPPAPSVARAKTPAEGRKRLLVIGLDSIPPEFFFDTFLPEMPNVRELLGRSTYGGLRTTDPPISVPAWPVMFSGVDPGSLGLYGFRHRKPNSYTQHYVPTADQMPYPSIWQLLSQQGKRVGVIGMPPGYPPPRVNGFYISDFLTPDGASDWIQPPELKDEVLRLCRGRYPFDVVFRAEERETLFDEIVEMTETRFDLALELYGREPWDVFAVHEIGPDRFHHAYWKYFDAAHPRHEPGNPFEMSAHTYYRLLDAKIGKLVDAADERTAVVIASDHGSMPMTGCFCINEWLWQKGYLVLRSPPAGPVPLERADVDWARTRVWGAGGYYARLFFNVRGRDPQGLLGPEELKTTRDRLLTDLQRLPGPDGRPLPTQVLDPKETYREVRGDPPDLMVYFDDLKWRSAGTLGHGRFHLAENDTGPDDAVHGWEGIFVVADPDRPARGRVATESILDVTPTLLEMLGAERPSHLQGRPMEAYLRRRAVVPPPAAEVPVVSAAVRAATLR